MKTFYIEDWLLEHGGKSMIVILLVVLGITLPLIVVRLLCLKKHRNDRDRED